MNGIIVNRFITYILSSLALSTPSPLHLILILCICISSFFLVHCSQLLVHQGGPAVFNTAFPPLPSLHTHHFSAYLKFSSEITPPLPATSKPFLISSALILNK